MIDPNAKISDEKIMVILHFEIDGSSIDIKMALINWDIIVLF